MPHFARCGSAWQRPLRDRFDGHSIIALAVQELASGIDDAPARIACLALAKR